MRLLTPRDVGLYIRERRQTLGMDQRTLAARVGVSRQWVVEIEQGKPRAEMGLVLRTLAALGVALHAEADGDRVPRAAEPSTAVDVDIDAIIERARGGER